MYEEFHLILVYNLSSIYTLLLLLLVVTIHFQLITSELKTSFYNDQALYHYIIRI